MASDEARYWPIIYVRGYAMSRTEIDDTTADPFCGFNLGSTTLRATPDPKQPPKKFIFESPVVRLQSDHGYGDVYEDGVDIMDPDWEGTIARKSIIIYRYYDSASTLLGLGKTPKIEEFATGLNDLILKVRKLVCDDPANKTKPADFRCYLVAHSMGGLVCRAFLQNTALGSPDARRCIDKFFTYATPHNGIEMAGVNVPGWLGTSDIDNFNRDRMAEYLDLKALLKQTGRVDWLPEDTFPSERVFCLIGTNRSDYDVAAGLSRTFAGHGSDGLVLVENASVWGVSGRGIRSAPSATAYAYRSHSGRFGIVNSEEAYQNLSRFLFGDVRVDLWVDVDDVRVPQELEKLDAQGKVNALYQFEVLASPRGKRWYLSRRIAEEDSVACRTHAELRSPGDTAARQIYLSTIFLANRYRVNKARRSLAYSLTLGVRAPDYEVERRFWPDRHYEGEYLFRDSIVLEMTPPRGASDWRVLYDWQSDNVGQASQPVPMKALKAGRAEVSIPFFTSDVSPPRSPGIAGRVRFIISPWNAEPGA
jgi:hypothetical protein